MALLNRDALLKKQDLKIVKVDLEDGDFVFVSQMTGRDRDRFEASIMKDVKDKTGRTIDVVQNLEDFRAKLLVFTLCDEAGNNLLEPGDYAALSINMSAARISKIVDAAQELNRITESDKEALVKNSEKGREGGSISASHKN